MPDGIQTNEQNIPALLFAAPGSGSGKTTLVCAALQGLLTAGFQPHAFKCGPDYIDPMFHREVLGVPSRNLDLFLMGEEGLSGAFAAGVREELSEAFAAGMREEGFSKSFTADVIRREASERAAYRANTCRSIEEADEDEASGKRITIVEGVMGLYDGLGGISEEASSYDVACRLGLPVILIVDAKGMGRSLLPLLSGFLSYDREKRIKGVILNRTTKGFCDKVAPLIEEELNLPVLGCFPECKDLQLRSRHLGLVLPEELGDIRAQLARAGELFVENVDMERLLAIAGEGARGGCGDGARNVANVDLREAAQDGEKCSAGEHDIKALSSCMYGSELHQVKSHDVAPTRHPRIAVARDEAFCFLYEDNLDLLKKLGAEIVFFSPIHDEALPAGTQGLLLPGGYPELYAEELALNADMRDAIREAIAGGMPSLAECGGFLYLHEGIRVGEDTRRPANQSAEGAEGTQETTDIPVGTVYPMCGVLPGICENQGHLVRFGYVEIRTTEHTEQATLLKNLLAGGTIRAHEFHYYDVPNPGEDCIAVKPVGGRSYRCMHAGENYLWGFPHLYYPSNPAFAARFVEACSGYCRHTLDAEGTNVVQGETDARRTRGAAWSPGGKSER